MKILNRYINTKQILRLLLVLAFLGTVSIFFFVNRMNSLLNTDLGFNKDSTYTIITHEAKSILPDSVVFSSELPGFKVKKEIKLGSEYLKEKKKFALQFISANYFDFFNYEKINEKIDLLSNHGNTQLVYINEKAVKQLGIYNIDDAPGVIICSDYSQYVICGVIKDKRPLTITGKQEGLIYQLTSEHLAYAFAYDKIESKDVNLTKVSSPVSFQTRLENHFRFLEDLSYSIFLFINIILLIIVLGYFGTKYTNRNEKAFYTILGVGIHVITIIISKTYLYLLAILGLVAGPLSLLIQKIWLEIYDNRVNFGSLDLFIFLSVVLLAVYLVCCPKTKINEMIKGKSIQINSK